MKRVTGGSILGGLIVVAIVIWFSIEIAEKGTSHPCQQISFDYLKSFKDIKNFDRNSATLQEIEEFNEGYEEPFKKKLEELKQNIIKYDCYNNSSEWDTEEFRGKMKFLIEYDFLP